MKIYLLRHADADTEAASDDERFLSEKGIHQAQRVARFCEAHELAPTVILASPLRRAHQTAGALAEHLKVRMETVRWLGLGATPEEIIERLHDYGDQPSVMLVGHEPSLGQIAGTLLTGARDARVHVRKASLTAFQIAALEPGGGTLEFSVPVKLM